ncbi:sensor histidine kinase [Tenacibaculum agarivorans]|uniref:sensor histidine kinase n=1 Tax=Tenacibaculum agarivorans TaxID=1908389 RepID=UPI00094BBDA7|nr:HAMP domain-containing sensor histidine kinase [Tenacibaculum agarivorans]
MNTKRYNWIFYFIIITIITTLIVQFYWNYKNYQLNKQRVHNEIKESFEDAVDDYITRSDVAIYLNSFRRNENPQNDYIKTMDSLFIIFPLVNEKYKLEKSYYLNNKDSLPKKRKISKNYSLDSIVKKFSSPLLNQKKITVKSFDTIKNYTKIVTVKDNSYFQNKLKMIIDIMDERILDINEIDSLLKNSLDGKKINANYSFEYSIKDKKIINFEDFSQNNFKILRSDSPRLPSKSNLKLKYTSPSIEILKRSFTGILLSLLLSLAVISSLFYLLKVIQQQKQLAEIKNDLISNITHEFKTPITTVSTALEAITSFNVVQDVEKTKKYIAISEHQIQKLHLMVEKLLETATLDSEKLLLKEEPIDIIHLLEKLSNKHQLFTTEKEILFSSNIETLTIQVDPFHLENAISNLLDNAIKYGGNMIKLICKDSNKEIEISVSDNGLGIDKNQQEKIFDKFYRVPKGNTHDVKGFGIGLYYTKKIIEKHKGSIQLTSTPEATTFKILLPHE